jgi:DNA-binding transcriptional LysR family regulator
MGVDALEQMATFVRIVEAGSLTAAARQLRVSSAAVSRQLAALEEDLGAPLLMRTTRRMAPTDAGRGYYDRCRRILQEVDEARAAVRAPGTVEGLLVVSAPVTLGLAKITPRLPALVSRHPGLRVELRLEDRLVDLVGDGVDVAIRAGVEPPDTTEIVAHPLMRYDRVVVASDAYLERHGRPTRIEALGRHDALVHLSGIEGAASWILRHGKRVVEIAPTGVFRSNAPYALREAALGGLGVALLPDWLVDDDVARGALRVVLPDWRARPNAVVALHRAELRGLSRVRALLEHLRAGKPVTASASRPRMGSAKG